MPDQPQTLGRPKPRPTPPRPSAAARGYDEAWRRARLHFLAEHPWCADCADRGEMTAANEVDHVQALEAGGAKFDPANLRALCKVCHSRKTVRVDGGLGLGEAAKGRGVMAGDQPGHV